MVFSLSIDFTILDIISIDNNAYEIIQSKKDERFKDTIFDIKSSNSNGNIVMFMQLF